MKTATDRTTPWPHPDNATRYDTDIAFDCRPYAEGYHAALYGHSVDVCPYVYSEDWQNRVDWFIGFKTRMRRQKGR